MILIKIKTRKEGSGTLLELPEGLANSSNPDAELFPLRDGFYLLSLGGLGAARPPSHALAPPALSGPELSVLEKISRVRFEQRTPSAIEKILLPDEKKHFAALLEKNAVWLFKKGKYADNGVYNIAESIYPRGAKMEGQGAGKQADGVQNAPASPILGGNEYAIIEQDGQQKFQDASVIELLKKGEILGVKGFDKRLYVATRAFYDGNLPEFLKSLSSGAKNPDQISEELKMNPDACRVMLVLLCENGEAIEKKKGMYQAV